MTLSEAVDVWIITRMLTVVLILAMQTVLLPITDQGVMEASAVQKSHVF